ncbi:MAG: hypothetical protein ACI4IV_03505 [Acutalibacteraceae bacterium]
MKSRTAKRCVSASVMIIIVCAAVCGLIIWKSVSIDSLSETNDPLFSQQQSSRKAALSAQQSELDEKNAQLSSIKQKESQLKQQISSVQSAIAALTTDKKAD